MNIKGVGTSKNHGCWNQYGFRFALTLAILFGFLPYRADGANIAWANSDTTSPPGVGQEWSLDANWAGAKAPVDGDSVSIFRGTLPAFVLLNSTSATVASVTVRYGSEFTINSTGVLNSNNNIITGNNADTTTSYLNIKSGGKVVATGQIQAAMNGVVTSAGDISGTLLNIFNGGKVEMSGGKMTFTQQSTIGGSSSSTVQAILDQKGGTITTSNHFVVDYGAKYSMTSGTFEITDSSRGLTIGGNVGTGGGSKVTVAAGGTVNANLAIKADGFFESAGTVYASKSVNIQPGGGAKILGGSLTAVTSIIVGDGGNAAASQLTQEGGVINTPIVYLKNGTYRIRGGSVTTTSSLEVSPSSYAKTLEVVGSGATIKFDNFRNNAVVGDPLATFSFVLDNSAAHISTVNFVGSGYNVQTLRNNANLKVGLNGGVLLSSTNEYTIISRAGVATDTAWINGVGALWTDTTDGNKTDIKIGLNATALKGTLDASSGNPVTFTAANLGYINLSNVNLVEPIQLELKITGGTLSKFTDALTAAGITTWTTTGLSPGYDLAITFNPAISGGNYFAWDFSGIDSDLRIQSIALIPEPSTWALVSLSLACVVASGHFKRRAA